MNRTSIALASAVLALSTGAAPARADTTPFIFDRVVFQDEKEIALKAPEGVACDDAGNFVVADSGNGRLVSYRYVAGSVSSGKEIKPAGIAYPRRIQFDSKGNLFVLDAKDHKIHKVDPQGAVLGKIELKSGASAFVSMPVAFKLDASDNVYVVDAVAARVVVLDPGGAVIRQLELPKGTVAVSDVHVDAAGTVYVIDGAQAAIWSADKAATAFKPFTTSMKDRMNFPVYLTGSRGRFFVVDQNGNGIVVLGADGSFQGRQLAIGWGDGFLYYPGQLCMNASGDAYIADRQNNRVQIFNTSR